MIDRHIDLPPNRSFFLFGPRQTGKSTLVRSRWTRETWAINLLRSEEFFKYAKEPQLLRLEALHQIEREGVRTIFIDEAQRVPALLDEVHALLELHPDRQFILTGSSARKLKHGAANLLAGRLVTRQLFPFTYDETAADFDLEEVLRFGSLPAIHGQASAEKIDILRSYAETYLREEIQAEGLVRRLGGFSRFLDIAAAQCGELVNFSDVGRQAALPTRTVQSYYEILEDTLVGLRLEAYHKSVRKRLTRHPKFYLFDLGVTNAVNRRLGAAPDPLTRGRLFEQLIVLETHRHLSYKLSENRLYYWRTNAGAEVDLLVEKGDRIVTAIEIKSTARPGGADLSGLRALRQEHPQARLILVSNAGQPHSVDGVEIVPWRRYLANLDDYAQSC